MAEWDAELEVGEALARTLITDQFPDLDASTLRRIGEGWDNTVWATTDGIAFRFPRREIALPGIRREMAILPLLAPLLPNPIPDAAYAGRPSDRFPWPWFGSRLIDGSEIALTGLGDGARIALATDLGRFLRALHGLELPAATALETDPLGRADMARRVPRTREMLAALGPAWTDHRHHNEGHDLARRADEVLTEAEALPTSAQAVLVHGDLSVRHALVSPSGRLAGVIDWGDIARGPSAIDLTLYWSAFPPPARGAFRTAYGELTDDTLLRARVLALCFDAMLAAYARDKGMELVERETLRGLERTLTG